MDDLDSSTTTTTTFNPTDDITSQLSQRYSSSSAPQHRHLIATSAAIKSMLLEHRLPLSPLSYFAAAMSTLSGAPSAPSATLLSIALPLVPRGSLSPDKAGEAVRVLVALLSSEEKAGSTATAKCVVKCLGVLLGFCDSSDWSSVQLTFHTLLTWSIHKRPKVRRCALLYLEIALKSFQSGQVKKKASKLILTLLETHMSMALKLGVPSNLDGSGCEKQHEADHSDIVHVLSVVSLALPHLSDKFSVKIVFKFVELLHERFSAFTRLLLNGIEAFLDKAEVEVVSQVAEDISGALSSYVSFKGNPEDSVISAANLLKIAIDKTHAVHTGKWNKCLSPGFNAIAGLLTREDSIASKSSQILKNMIDHQLSGIECLQYKEEARNDAESNAIASICSVFTNILDSFDGIPNENTLAVLSFLFLKLGRNSFMYMRSIVLKLAGICIHTADNESMMRHLEQCFGCAVVGMGAENVLSLVPISFNVESSTCSNMWLLPILKKYIFGASLGYFMEHLVPVAESLQRASRKVKKSVIGQDLQAHAHGLWGLLRAFCRWPTDLSESYQSFAKLLLVRLKKDAFMHEDIADALQELVNQNKSLLKSNPGTIEPLKYPSEILLEDYLLEKKSLLCYSKKVAKRNTKALALYSHELLQALMIVFLDSPLEKRSYLKNAISCLASISESSVTKKIFISSLERFPMVKADNVLGESELSNASLNSTPVGDESRWPLVLNLASSVVVGADEDLVGLIFRLTKHALQVGDGIGVSEAYRTLSCILEEHPWFCSSNMDELVDLIISLKSPADTDSTSNRLCCLRILLVHALKSSSDVENTKPFLILNDIVLALKDSKEDARKTAYDVLLKISSDLGESSAANPDGPYSRLISMIMGYLSGPSPHITSAAISALSVLVFQESKLCVNIPDVVPSVTSLLQTKAVEVIKAVLGFVKVLVSCLDTEDLQKFTPSIMDGVLPWSSVSRHHFRSKVTVILEIMIRKCGFPTVKLATPERYHSFVKNVSLSRHGKSTSKDADSTDTKQQVSDNSTNGPKKRLRDETRKMEDGPRVHKRRLPFKDDHRPPGRNGTTVREFDNKSNRFKGKNHRPPGGNGDTVRGFDNKANRFKGKDRRPPGGNGTTVRGFDKKFNHFKSKGSGFGHAPGKPTTGRRENFGREGSKPGKRFGSNNSRNDRSGVQS